jgi:putative ABC transport system substrate-binding protein
LAVHRESTGADDPRADRVLRSRPRCCFRDLGWIEGKNILIDFRWAERVDQLPELATGLVGMKVDLIFAPSSTFVEAARQATKTIPIVTALDADPVGLGHVASLARPGGNITGLTMLSTELGAPKNWRY